MDAGLPCRKFVHSFYVSLQVTYAVAFLSPFTRVPVNTASSPFSSSLLRKMNLGKSNTGGCGVSQCLHTSFVDTGFFFVTYAENESW